MTMTMIILMMIILLLLIVKSLGLDVSWLPNDENAPLPLSVQYRQSLRRLCLLIEKGSRLPPEIETKKNVLKKMCSKLRDDDDNIQSSIKFKYNMKNVAIVATSLGGSYFIWHNRKAIGNVFNNIIRSFRKSNSIDSDQMLRDIREARLKRFQ